MARDKACCVCSERRESVQTNVDASAQRWVSRCWDRLALVDDFDDGVAVARHDARLLHSRLSGPNADAQLRRHDLSASQPDQANRLDVIDQQVAALVLVLVAGQARPPQDLRWVCFPGGHVGKESSPVVIELAQHIIADLAWQSTVGFMVLDAVVDRCEAEVAPA
jgi:hypothetical protein